MADQPVIVLLLLVHTLLQEWLMQANSLWMTWQAGIYW